MNEAAHKKHLKDLRRRRAAAAALAVKQRVHETMDFHLPRSRDIFSLLRRQYDPEGLAHPANQVGK